ncbi:HupE/UreJ family protein [Aquimarina spongiae]|uniref:HupE / UreJ protein n=1 Tax=Aquimarina spongiae TaxID=570521 RepID=A0A1M6EKG8_9FLAO|nr:HupE/UreJ family protein [Aquimarina spongiae]SHI85886.1 HupE / UreJ protein [Aquimarina spongiae]
MSEFWLYIKLGFSHVLDWTAYDHILFLIVLIVGYTFDNWKRILLLVTLFTVGHTISLFLAAYNVVSVNSRLIEFLIPVTILLTALYNVFTSKSGSKNDKVFILYGATLFFGLIHGFGFSTYFKAISSNTSSKILPLIEFALGVEAAQVVIVFFVLIVSFVFVSLLRFSKREWILIASSVVIGMVIPMLVENKIW